MRTHEPLYHGQAQSRPFAAVGNECPDTGLKQVPGETGAIVTDAQLQEAVDGLRIDDDPARPVAKRLAGVEQQVQQCLAEQGIRQAADDFIGNILLDADPDEYLQSGVAAEGDNELIETLVEQRLQARRDKNWVEADRIRDKLQAMGVELEDKGGNTSWRRA